MSKTVGIVGFKGRVAQRHIKAWKELGWKWQGCDHEHDFYEFVKKKFDIIDICTPIYLHPQMIVGALRYSDVICEKPIAPNWEIGVATVYQIQEQAKHRVGIIHQFRYNPKIIKLREELEKGKYGEIKLVTSHYYRWRDPQYYGKWEGSAMTAGGGVVLNVTIHYLDLLQWLFGYPTIIKGVKTTAKGLIDVEDTACAVMKFPCGAIGNYIATTHCNPPKHYELSIYGTKRHTKILLKENEYHKENFEAFINNKDYVTPMESLKSLRMAMEVTQ